MATLYSITISAQYRTVHPDFLYNDDKLKIIKWLNRFSDHYIIVPEFSENGRLHYHGLLRICDKIKYYKTKYFIDKEIGFVKVEKINDFKSHLRWLMYINKNYYILKDDYPLFYYNKPKRKRIKTINCFNQLRKQNKLNIINYFKFLASLESNNSDKEDFE